MLRRSSLLDFFDAAFHVEIPFGNIVVFALENFFEPPDRIGYRNLFALSAGKYFRDAERLAQEALDLAGAEHGELVFGRKFIHTEDGDDVLEVLISLEHALNAASDVIMLRTYDVSS